MIKVISIFLILAAAAYILQEYRKEKRRKQQEQQADIWLSLYSGYSVGSSCGGVRPPQQENDIGVIRSQGNVAGGPTKQTESKQHGGGYVIEPGRFRC